MRNTFKSKLGMLVCKVCLTLGKLDPQAKETPVGTCFDQPSPATPCAAPFPLSGANTVITRLFAARLKPHPAITEPNVRASTGLWRFGIQFHHVNRPRLPV